MGKEDILKRLQMDNEDRSSKNRISMPETGNERRLGQNFLCECAYSGVLTSGPVPLQNKSRHGGVFNFVKANLGHYAMLPCDSFLCECAYSGVLTSGPVPLQNKSRHGGVFNFVKANLGILKAS
ncbi:hypothetical protein H6P81_000481 [Aristolochia fimbriata]|uniref:Uncharacterized protein n=1 Tax=Aristolochia fimbriata TaxID=158543 RepID=A0AAV7F8R8_ARIFI|nr:hypothetical protein H6P81_000481 [Aristolochia fimbriata]